MTETSSKPYGVMAEFPTPEAAAKAARVARQQGFLHLDAYGPFASPELAEAIGFRETKMSRCVLGGGIFGGICGYALVYYATVVSYPHNIGGRPINSWPAFIPIVFETTVLGACVIGIISLLILNGLPRLSHPVFSSPKFVRATNDHFFLCLLATTENFSEEKARETLRLLTPLSIATVMEEPTTMSLRLLFLSVLMVVFTGCHRDMYVQPYKRPFAGQSRFS